MKWPFVWRSRYEREGADWAEKFAQINRDITNIQKGHQKEREGLFNQLREVIAYMNETRAVWQTGAEILQVTMCVTRVAWDLHQFRRQLLESMFKEMTYKIGKTTGVRL